MFTLMGHGIGTDIIIAKSVDKYHFARLELNTLKFLNPKLLLRLLG